MRQEGVKGHLELILLGVISGGSAHGYEVITRLREQTGGALDLAEGAVYPALHRLEDLGLLASEWHPVAGRRRRVYSMTSEGREALSVKRRDWRDLVRAVEAALEPGGRVAVVPS